MAMYQIFNASIYSYYKTLIDHLNIEKAKVENEDLRVALNLNIILCCACYIEGFLENKLKGIQRFYGELYCKVEIPELQIRKPMNIFYYNLEKYLQQRISQCMGVEKYDELFKLFIGKSIKSDPNIANQIETIQVLFQLRNVIAHGREVSAYVKITDRENMLGDEFFFGGYKKAEDLLIKKGLLSEKFTQHGGPKLFFTNDISAFFFSASETFVLAVDDFINNNLKFDNNFTSYYLR